MREVVTNYPDDDGRVVPVEDRAADRFTFYWYGEPILVINLDDPEEILKGIALLHMALDKPNLAADRAMILKASQTLHARYEAIYNRKSD